MCLDSSVNTSVVSLFGPDSKTQELCSIFSINYYCLNLQFLRRYGKYKALYSWLKEKECAVFYLHSIFVYRVFALLNFTPSIQARKIHLIPVRHHNQVHRIDNSWRGLLLDWILAKCYKVWVAVSRNVKARLIEVGVSDYQIHVIINGLYRADTLPTPNLTSDKLRIISIGRLDFNKNHKAQLRVASILKKSGLDFSLDIFGVGPTANGASLEREIEDRDLQELVSLRGYQANIDQYLNDFDLLLHTSLDEACPLVIIEALLSSLPIISSNNEGCQEILGGFYPTFSPDDVQGIASEILRLSREKSSAFTKAKSISKEVYETYSGLRMSRDYNSLALNIHEN